VGLTRQLTAGDGKAAGDLQVFHNAPRGTSQEGITGNEQVEEIMSGKREDINYCCFGKKWKLFFSSALVKPTPCKAWAYDKFSPQTGARA
jgi:hypothetical protein